MTVFVSRDKINSGFTSKVQRLADQNLMACYQCGKCSAGCPMAAYMDVPPNQMIRLAQLGMEDELLDSEAIWLCVSCMTCNMRCPKGVRIAELIESMRQIKLRARQDHLQAEKISKADLRAIPPIALIGSMRKFTS
ncbi:MAG: 4Fe-4S dicluster domain-containing protein [gamma proteobacterium endosymbiont of Lamellibrachia anaximandri]|nr:4Fe-4S dicluster domain-containing protein [gamma proteobacterium endosymbiont of Lamellibrachia anaximandri]MBL3534428.1 4Fe-4S dicluster domain-containing protein [gamma proteobacterium endosymbiont of Lamellibrachia anaximandri]MBL3601122.1 4Fe-4S dicluster domain-containing protein [gamma proteobacterium endosymbiont of Lamellibrachia anaximandri]